MFSRVHIIVILYLFGPSIIESVNTNGLELVSQLKNATQSSNHGPGIAGRAVDGGTDGNYFHHSCSHTLHGLENPWWYVDLGSPTVISKIVIYNRDECCGDRLNGAVVGVGNDNVSPFTANTQCGTTIRVTWFSSQIELTCNPAIEGQYISVYLRGNVALSLCEVKAYKDILNPIVFCPEDMVLDSEVIQSLQPVTWNDLKVIDNIDRNIRATCTPSSGSQFEVGFTKVTCSTTDQSRNEGNCSFVVNIADNEEPSLTCPEHITVNSNVDQSEDPVTWSDPTVTDNIHKGMSATCTPASGSIFDVGSTIVTCSATDGTGNEGSCSFVVHVKGQIFISDVPIIMCPHNMTISTDQPVSITWNDPKVTDSVDTDLSTTCTPPSGSSFNVGFTNVTCSATNSFGNEDNCWFSIHITGDKSSKAFSHSDDDSDTTSGYLIAVVVLSVVVFVMTSASFILYRRYTNKYNGSASGEDNNVAWKVLK